MPMNLAIDNDGALSLMGHTVRRDVASNKGSAIDVVLAIDAAKDSSNAQNILRRVFAAYPTLGTRCTHLKINNKGRETPVADAATLLEIIWLCPGRTARVRKHSLQML